MLIQDFLTPAQNFDTGTTGGAIDKYEVWLYHIFTIALSYGGNNEKKMWF